MKLSIHLLAPVALAAGAVTLATQYKADRSTRVEITTSISSETTEMKVERDGEPMEGRGGGGSSSSEFTEVHVDHVIEVEKGQPTKVRRTFEKLDGKSSRTRGEETRDTDIASPIEGVTIELTPDGDKAAVEVVEGSKPDDDAAFEHQRVASFLDVGLPEGEVEAGATWELSKEQVLALLRVDVHGGLFPPPPREESGTEGGGRRRGGGGFMGGGGMDAGLLARADWKGKAKLKSAAADVDGVSCAVIEVSLEASGELEMPQRGERGPRMAGAASAGTLGNSYTLSLEGTLNFALEARRPASLEVEGKLSTTFDSESEGRDGSTIRMHVRRDGKVAVSVKVTDEAKK
jgi:hypothetical protein